MRHLLVIAGLTAALAAASASAEVQEQMLFRGAGPVRDPRNPPAAVGTAVIRGRVFAADTGRPLRRARVQVSAPELGPEARTTSTNLDGRFEIRNLPAGRYVISVNRSGYLRLSYGQRRPFEQGKPLQLSDKQLADNIDFTLPRMSLITGRVFDETNEPMAGVRVFAMRTQFFDGRRRVVPVAGGPVGNTDDAGQYRLTGLAPGSYFVLADSRETWTVTEGANEQVMGYAPTYYPGATTIADGKRVTVGLGQEASNVDFSMMQGRAATVSGTAVDSQGRPLAGRTVALRQEYRSPGFGMFGMVGQAPVSPDGSFVIRNVPPGEYSAVAGTTSMDAAGASVPEAGAAPVVVAGMDLNNVSIVTSAGWSLAGSMRTDTGEVPAFARDRVRVRGRMLDADASPSLGPPGPPPGGPGAGFGGGIIGGGMMLPDSGRVRDDWTFSVSGLFGPAQIRVSLPDGWTVKSITQDGRDITDAPLEARSGETVSGVQVLVTNRVTKVSGELTDEKGAPVTDGTVIVFASEPERWSEDSRFVQSARPDQNGKFQVQGLPAGEYLAIAIDYVEEGMWNDPEYLESIRGQAQRLTLGDGETRAIALKVANP